MARTRNREDASPETNGEFSPVPETPPTVTRGREGGKWGKIMDPLRENPGQWFRVTAEERKNPNSLASFLDAGKATGVGAGEFDFIARTTRTETQTDDEGNPLVDKNGNAKTVSYGHVYAICLTEDQAEEKAEHDRIAQNRRERLKAAETAEEKEQVRKNLTPLPERSYMPA